MDKEWKVRGMVAIDYGDTFNSSIKNLFVGLTQGDKPYTVNVEVIKADHKKGEEEKTEEGQEADINEQQG